MILLVLGILSTFSVLHAADVPANQQRVLSLSGQYTFPERHSTFFRACTTAGQDIFDMTVAVLLWESRRINNLFTRSR